MKNLFKDYQKFEATLVIASFVFCIFAAVSSFFTVFNFLGIVSGKGVGDWASFFFWSMTVCWILFGLLNLNETVREFWKSI